MPPSSKQSHGAELRLKNKRWKFLLPLGWGGAFLPPARNRGHNSSSRRGKAETKKNKSDGVVALDGSGFTLRSRLGGSSLRLKGAQSARSSINLEQQMERFHQAPQSTAARARSHIDVLRLNRHASWNVSDNCSVYFAAPSVGSSGEKAL